jgi:hypothetical protein
MIEVFRWTIPYTQINYLLVSSNFGTNETSINKYSGLQTLQYFFFSFHYHQSLFFAFGLLAHQNNNVLDPFIAEAADGFGDRIHNKIVGKTKL